MKFYLSCSQQLHLIELIRNGEIEEALHFAQEQLSEAGESDPTVLNELERTLALLAFEEPKKCPFRDLLHPTHRQKVSMCHLNNTGGSFCKSWQLLFWGMGGKYINVENRV